MSAVSNDITVPAREVLSAARLRVSPLSSILVAGVNCPGAHALAASVAVEASHSLSSPISELRLSGRSPKVTASGTGRGADLNVDLLADPERVRLLIAAPPEGGMFMASADDLLAIHESRVLAVLVDCVILLAGRGTTTETQLREARRQLDAMGTNLIGSIYVS